MAFRYYTNLLSQASRTVAASIMVVGMLLIGFAMLIMALPALFAFLAAAVFFLAGCTCAIVAVKMFWAQRQFDKHLSDDEDAYRENVVIHHRDDHDL
jgi:membrane protein implicated in regulation of membrane protease activity